MAFRSIEPPVPQVMQPVDLVAPLWVGLQPDLRG
jgi:hypothetical protein